MYWLLTHLFRAVPQSYLISCCLGLSPQQVCWIKPLSWLLDSAFFFPVGRRQVCGVVKVIWQSRHLEIGIYFISGSLFPYFLCSSAGMYLPAKIKKKKWMNEWMMSHGSWWREHTDTTWAVKTCHRHRLHKGLVASSTHRLRIIAFSPNMERYQALPELPQGAGLRNWCSVPRSGNSRVACYTVIRGHIFYDLMHLVFLHPVYYFF